MLILPLNRLLKHRHLPLDASKTYADEQLLRLLKVDDESAFESLYKKYWPQLFDAAYKRLKSREAAEEMVQDVFTSLWYNRRKIEITHSFSTYLHSSLKYKVISHYRSLAIQNKYLDTVQHEKRHLSIQVEEELYFNELSSAIETEINRLPDKCREAFNLSRKENLSFKEIALQMEISVNTVEKHVGKALKTLRTNLKEYISVLILIIGNLLSL